MCLGVDGCSGILVGYAGCSEFLVMGCGVLLCKPFIVYGAIEFHKVEG